MRKLLIGLMLLPLFVVAQNPNTNQPSVPGLLKEKLKSAIPNVNQAIQPPDKYAYQTLPWLHSFLDTASSSSILRFLDETSDSILQMVQYETMMWMEGAFRGGVVADYDGDGHNAVNFGGDDCIDFDRFCFPGNPERCNGFHIMGESPKKYLVIYAYHDEDCDPCTVAGQSPDGDKDRDGQVCASCVNYWTVSIAPCVQGLAISTTGQAFGGYDPLRRSTFRGWDCNDNDSRLLNGSQICKNPQTISVCEQGRWKDYPCRKCVTQPNGSGVVVE